MSDSDNPRLHLYGIGSEVVTTCGGSPTMTVDRVMIEGDGHVSYQCHWWSDGHVDVRWFAACEIEPDEPRPRIIASLHTQRAT